MPVAIPAPSAPDPAGSEFTPPMAPLVTAVPNDATASIVLTITNPAPTVPSTYYSPTYAEVRAACSPDTYAGRNATFGTYQDEIDYQAPAPPTTSLDLWRREGSSGDGIRIAADLTPGVDVTDWTPASGLDYEYRATAYAASNSSITEGVWSA